MYPTASKTPSAAPTTQKYPTPLQNTKYHTYHLKTTSKPAETKEYQDIYPTRYKVPSASVRETSYPVAAPGG